MLTGGNMRSAIAWISVLLAASIVSTTCFAFTPEPAAPQSQAGTNFAEPEASIDEMAKSGSLGGGFYVSGGAGQQLNSSDSPFDANRPNIPATPYGYVPSPALRSR
jgi:hypothetical protein